MITTMKNQNGAVAAFNPTKIYDAICKANICIANETLTENQLNTLTQEIVIALQNEEKMQNTVNQHSIQNCYDKMEKVYMHCAEHAKRHEIYQNLMETYQDLTFHSSAASDVKRENANIDADTAMGIMLKYGSEGAKCFYDTYVIPSEMAIAHQNGDIHIHDKDFYALTETCCQIDLIQLFKGGFSTGHGFLREPNDIRSYAALACIAIQANQNEMHGGQSIPNFDYAMALGVAKTFRKCYTKAFSQALQLQKQFPKAHAAAVTEAMMRETGIDITMSNGDTFCKTLMAHIVDKPTLWITPQEANTMHAYAAQTAWDDTNDATYQAMEALIHNLNTMNSRAGAQVPFSSLNYGTDTSPEGRMVIKNILLATEKGLGDGETAIFPIQIFKVKEDVNYNPKEPNYDLFQLAIRVSAKRLFPNFSFIDAPFNRKYYKKGRPETEISYMGCRTRVISNVHDPNREIINGRGNLSFTSVNLPRIAIKANRDLQKFYQMLDEKIDLMIAQLLHRFHIQCSKKVYNYPFLMGQGIWMDSEQLQAQDSIAQVLKHGSLSVGFIGLAETLKALCGKHHGENADSQKLGLEIIAHMRKRMDDKAKETSLNFSLLATPAEGLSGRFVQLDRKRYGVIEGVTDRDYYTNSFHIPVYYPIKVYEKIMLEAPYHNLTNAGHISYVELDGDTCKNLEAFEAVIRCMKQAGIGYGSINHPVDRDPCCGYNGIIDNECPKCHRTEQDGPKFERIRRITGYLVGTTDRWNNAKRTEERDRVKHSGC